jgi:hypothetical protein
MTTGRICYDLVDIQYSKCPDVAQSKYIRTCVRLAEKSSLTHKHGCVIVDKKSAWVIFVSIFGPSIFGGVRFDFIDGHLAFVF